MKVFVLILYIRGFSACTCALCLGLKSYCTISYAKLKIWPVGFSSFRGEVAVLVL